MEERRLSAFDCAVLIRGRGALYYRGITGSDQPIRGGALGPCVRNFVARCQRNSSESSHPLERPEPGPEIRTGLSVRIRTRIRWPLLVISPVIGGAAKSSYLMKPCLPEQLAREISECLRTRQKRA